MALTVLRELMITAADAETYAVRRDAFLRLCREETPPCATVAQILRYFAVEVPSLPFDNRDSLVLDILDHTADEEALVLFLLEFWGHGIMPEEWLCPPMSVAIVAAM